MKTNKTILRVFSAFCLTALALVLLPAVADAQGRYTGRYSKRDVSNIIGSLERSSDNFRRDFDRYLDESSLNGTREEDRINGIVNNYENALDRLRRDFDRFDTWWESRANVQNVMSEARQVNAMMNSLQFARRLERQWNQMRRDINKLADTYDLPDLAGGGGNWNGGGGNVPSWALGTFYARNPQTGGEIALTIDASGAVTISMDGAAATSYATMNGDRLTNDGIVSRVTRINDGIRTTRLDNGERIDYFRNPNVGGGGGGGNVPSWAIGTFSARNPQTGGTITLSIARNGSVTITMDGGATSYATISGDRLTNAGIVSRVTRINGGIRTTRLDNGERIDYFSGGAGGGGNVQGGNVPSWAVGRFYGRNPQTGGTITLDINNNGNVVITFDNGSVVYATMNGDRLYNEGIESRVTRLRNGGIRTTRVDNGESIDYRK